VRTDAIIDKRQVRCPNASHLGFDRWQAQVGDLILFTDGERTSVGRMIGRVHYAPPCVESLAVHDWLLVVGLAADLGHTFERWVNPLDVERVQSIREEHSRILTWFLSDQMIKADVQEVRKSTSNGWSTLDAYHAWKDRNARDAADYEQRKAQEVQS